MNLVIVSLALCSVVSANPTPQFFGYQPATPVGQWVSNNLQNSLQSVANAIQSIARPGLSPSVAGSQVVPVQTVVQPNQIPNGPNNYGQVPIQTVVQPVPVQTIVQPYPQGFYPPGPYPPGPYNPGPYDQIHVIPVPPPNGPWPNNGIPYRVDQNDESTKSPNWAPLPPLYYQFGEPSIVIISRPPSKPVAPQNESASNEDSQNQQNSTTVQPDATTPQTEQTSTPTPGKN